MLSTPTRRTTASNGTSGKGCSPSLLPVRHSRRADTDRKWRSRQESNLRGRFWRPTCCPQHETSRLSGWEWRIELQPFGPQPNALPLDQLPHISTPTNWSRRQDSNLHRADYRSAARPLGRRRRFLGGGRDESRTRYLRDTNAAFSLLNFAPNTWRLQPASNRRSPHYECGALPSEPWSLTSTTSGAPGGTRTRVLR